MSDFGIVAFHVTSCNRCERPIHKNDAESCWYCLGYLCFDCWEKYGHCGHKEADKINEEARKV